MKIGSDSQKQALTAQVAAELERRLGARGAVMAVRFADKCVRRIPIEDLVSAAPSTLATIVIRQLEFLQQRAPGQMLIRVYNPDPAVDGWDSPHTIVEVVNDDMPFLVDTGALTLTEMGLGIHLITHPIIRVTRDAAGKLTGPALDLMKPFPDEMLFDTKTDPEQFDNLVDSPEHAALVEDFEQRMAAKLAHVRDNDLGKK